MRYFPIGLDLEGRHALAVGAAGEIVRKILSLVAAGALVTVLAESGEIDPRIAREAEIGALTLAARPLDDADLERAWIVLAVRGDLELEAKLAAWASENKRLACVLDRPDASTFANLAVTEVSGLTLAFGSGGASPGLVRRIREDMEALFGDPRFGRFVDALRALRASLPREGRAATMARAVEGFAVEARLVFPGWFDRGDSRPP